MLDQQDHPGALALRALLDQQDRLVRQALDLLVQLAQRDQLLLVMLARLVLLDLRVRRETSALQVRQV